MKLGVHRNKLRVARRKLRGEFVLLEEFVGERYFDPGPFLSKSKMLHPTVLESGGTFPNYEAAVARVRHLSQAFWPKERYEGDPRVPEATFDLPSEEPSRMPPDRPACAQRGLKYVPSTLPSPACSIIWLKYPPEWYTKDRRKRR